MIICNLSFWNACGGFFIYIFADYRQVIPDNAECPIRCDFRDKLCLTTVRSPYFTIVWNSSREMSNTSHTKESQHLRSSMRLRLSKGKRMLTLRYGVFYNYLFPNNHKPLLANNFKKHKPRHISKNIDILILKIWVYNKMKLLQDCKIATLFQRLKVTLK